MTPLDVSSEGCGTAGGGFDRLTTNGNDGTACLDIDGGAVCLWYTRRYGNTLRALCAREDTALATKDPLEPFTRISVQEAKEMIEDGDVQVIDSREPWEHAEGHVPGSINIPHMATLPRNKELATDKPIIFICKSGQRSAVAAEFAATAGLTELFNVEGGHTAWVAAGYEMETGD